MPRTRQVAFFAIALAVATGANAQSVVNTLSRPASAKPPAPVPLSQYNPVTPPAADVPTVVSPQQGEIAAALEMLPEETNDQYTRRMKVRYEAATQDLRRVVAEHQIRMRALAPVSPR